MSFKTIAFQFLSVCYYLRTIGVLGSNAKAYLYYENAQCTDDVNIEGTYTIAFDDDNYSSYGYSDYYTGACLYLTDGYWEVDTSYYPNTSESIQYGTCLECDGQVGCSSDGTCDNFMSSVPQNSYQMTQDDGDGVEGGDDDSETAMVEDAYAMASQMQKSIIEALESNMTSDSTAPYVVAGAFIGCVAIAGLFITVQRSQININHIILQSTRSRVNVNRSPLTIDEVHEGIVV